MEDAAGEDDETSGYNLPTCVYFNETPSLFQIISFFRVAQNINFPSCIYLIILQGYVFSVTTEQTERGRGSIKGGQQTKAGSQSARQQASIKRAATRAFPFAVHALGARMEYQISRGHGNGYLRSRQPLEEATTFAHHS